MRMQLWIYHPLTSLVLTPSLVDFSKFNLDEKNIWPLVAPLGIPRMFSKGRMGISVRIGHLDRLLEWVSSTMVILGGWKALSLLTQARTFLFRGGSISCNKQTDHLWFPPPHFTEWMLLAGWCCCAVQRSLEWPTRCGPHTRYIAACPSVIALQGANTWIIRYVKENLIQ